jgi:hypothetical protein
MYQYYICAAAATLEIPLGLNSFKANVVSSHYMELTKTTMAGNQNGMKAFIHDACNRANQTN